jgi:hypothetical protein
MTSATDKYTQKWCKENPGLASALIAQYEQGWDNCSQAAARMQGQRDALAAHVERLRFTLIDAKRCVAVTAYPTLYIASQYKGLAKQAMRRIEEVGREAPATSLTRLKAQWQAEALESLASELARHGHSDAAQTARIRGIQLRQRAQELTQRQHCRPLGEGVK